MKNYRITDSNGRMGSEDKEQEALFEWAAVQSRRYPALEYMFHIPNGGKRDKAVAVAMRRQGVKAGVPDIMLPVAAYLPYVNGISHGLFIEMKAGKNKPTWKQKMYIEELLEQGYTAVVCYGSAMAAEVIEAYLNGLPVLEEYIKNTRNILAKVKRPEGPVI